MAPGLAVCSSIDGDRPAVDLRGKDETSGGSADAGSWRIQDGAGLVCFTWQNLRGGAELRSAFRLDGDNLVQLDAAGTLLNTAKGVPGHLATFRQATARAVACSRS